MGRITRQRRKYFLLNKKSDFLKGFGYGIGTEDSGITLGKQQKEGVYYTRVFDSRERHMVWHRLILAGEIPAGSSHTVTVYASESRNLMDGGETIEEILSDRGLEQEQKDEILLKFCCRVFENTSDMLLFGVKGRYLWLKITLRTQGEHIPRIGRIKLCFPKHTWLSYLPEIYSEDRKSASFLERYLGIFQALYEDMTDRIEETPALLEPLTANRELLQGMADWFSVENKEMWNEEQLRYLVLHGERIGRSRGTVAGLKELVWLYTGREPYVVEFHSIKPFFDGDKRERLLKKLYASNCFEFAVILGDGSRETEIQLPMLERVVAMAKPAHMTGRVVLLRPYIFLNMHSYLGINSTLGQYRPFRLDGSCAVSFSVIAKEKGGIAL